MLSESYIVCRPEWEAGFSAIHRSNNGSNDKTYNGIPRITINPTIPIAPTFPQEIEIEGITITTKTSPQKGWLERVGEGIGRFVDKVEDWVKGESKTKSAEDNRTSKDVLRRDERTKLSEPDPEAKGTKHTQLGTKKGSKGDYRQAREFDENNKPVRDIDFTNHGRPQNHPNPHQHKYEPNKTEGTMQRGKKAEPL